MIDLSRIHTDIPDDRHVLIAGPTASGKSALALSIAEQQGGLIVNADALQVWSCWRVLTARPSAADERLAPHLLYGHVTPDRAYSVGDWLKEVKPLLTRRLIIVGGTGLYLTALTEGLAYVPPTPAAVRSAGDAILAESGGLRRMIDALDVVTRNRIDLNNPARVQRAWEVFQNTNRGLADWQADTPPPAIPPASATCLILSPDRGWLADRIARRFDQMLGLGALDEVAAMLPRWTPAAQWARAIGAPELTAHLQGRMTRDDAVAAAVTATRQYAKSQRSWFRNRMKSWQVISVGE